MRIAPSLLAVPLIALATSAAHAESYVPPPIDQVDLLIVLDSSAGMADERAALVEQIEGFVDELYAGYPDGQLSLHVGVVTGDLGTGGVATAGCAAGGDGGRLQNPGGAGCSVTGNFVNADTTQFGEPIHNFEGPVSDAVACLIPRDVTGCAFQQPLAATREALTAGLAENAGFLRTDAVLAILYVTNQDDCSAQGDAVFDPATPELGAATTYRCARAGWACEVPLDGTARDHGACDARATSPLLLPPRDATELVAALKVDSYDIVIGMLHGRSSPVVTVGDGELAAIAPSCGAGTALAATPALRLEEFARRFDHGFTAEICRDDLGLTSFASAISTASAAPDLGERDAGVGPQVDASIGPVVDAGAAGDDGGDDLGGAPTEGTGGGCCSAGAPGASLTATLLALAGLLAGRRRRRGA